MKTYWIGPRAAIDAANVLAFNAYIGAHPTAICGETGDEIENPTRAWAVPTQDVNGAWVIPAYDGLEPAGVTATENVEWPISTE